MPRTRPAQGLVSRLGFAPQKLHSWSVAAWAVISVATGAIATDAQNRLLMRLTETEANRIAAAMSADHGPERDAALDR